MNRALFVIGLFLIPSIVLGQYEFSGYVDKTQWQGDVYLSIVEDYRKISGVYPEQIINKTTPDDSGFFSFTGNNLGTENRIYRIHVDNCLEIEQQTNHFTGHCSNSKEILFTAHTNDTLELPFSFDTEMFCKVVSTNEKANAFIRLDSLKEEMRFDFGTYRSEANRKINSKKWFQKLQNYSEQLQEPLVELYGYAFLSDRSHDLHNYYLEDLKENPYYEQLLQRLHNKYPGTNYVKQFEAELTADRYLIDKEPQKTISVWIYLLVIGLLFSIGVNIYLWNKGKHKTPPIAGNLTTQEQKVLDLILENKTNKEIAALLFLSVSTVKSHINALYKKLNITSREEAKSLFSK